jgi:hypothetical protein
MKQIYKIIFIVLLVTGLSCNKEIEIDPTHSASIENAFKSITDVETSLSDVYNSMRAVGYYGRNLSVMGDMMTDNLTEIGTSLANFREMTDWAYSSNNGTVAETWQACFLVINAANIIINNVDKFTTPALQKQANSIKGQAIGIRALVHFDLLRIFADSYDRNATGVGIPYITTSVLESSPIAFKPSRLTIKESYDKIYADIAAAKLLLADINALKLYFFLMFIKELEFNQMIIGIGLRLQVGFEFALPFFDDGFKETFCQVRIHDRVHHQCQVLMAMGNQVIKRFSISSSSRSVELIFPVPLQAGHASEVLIFTSGRIRWRVICNKPNFETGNTECFARSVFIKPSIASCTLRLLSGSFMSIKSTTIIPPISLNLNCRAISSAASRFVSSALSSWLLLTLL